MQEEPSKLKLLHNFIPKGIGGTPRNSSWGVPPASPNPDPISDQKMSFSTHVSWPGLWNPYPFSDRQVVKKRNITTGSRGDVFVVRTSKPVENLWSRYSFVTHYIYRKPRDWGLARSAYNIKYGKGGNKFGTDFRIPETQMEIEWNLSFYILGTFALVALRTTCRAPARIWLAVIDFQNGEQQSRSGSNKKRRNRLQ